tara:strand:+ start:2828 stop:3541 length:714 start_codon:yes stop_codon:yes gene_type:complete
MVKKTILITGASGGIGAELATYFSTKDFNLALHHNSTPIELAETENIAHFSCDLSKESSCQKLVSDVQKKFGSLDILINNAGISTSAMSWKMEGSAWEKSIAINLSAPFYLSKYALPLMRENKWGRIINITSIVAQTGFIGTAAYTSSKAGLIGLTKTLSKEVARSGVTVNSVSLGYFNTGMIDLIPENLQADIKNSIPIPEFGDPNVLSSTISWLLSNDGYYITGQTINLNGGLYS